MSVVERAVDHIGYVKSYTNGTETVSGAGANAGATIGTARRELAGATDNPGAFSAAGTIAGNRAATVIIRTGGARTRIPASKSRDEADRDAPRPMLFDNSNGPPA